MSRRDPPPPWESKEFRQLCGDPVGGVTAGRFASIVQAVQPTPEQRALLDELKRAAAKAADEFKRSCGDFSYAMTPPGRLRAMTNRISATLDAVRIVRPALEKFYNSLSDEQQARFNAIGPRYRRRFLKTGNGTRLRSPTPAASRSPA